MAREHSSDFDRPIVGWVEYVSFPDWGIPSVRAKMDTGAKSSALHVENLEEIGHGEVRFDLVLSLRPRRTRRVKARVRRRSKVRSSNGDYAMRVFVSTTLRFAGHERNVELSLVDRGAMIHRVLLGRTSLTEVLVDVTRRYRLGRKKAKKKR